MYGKRKLTALTAAATFACTLALSACGSGSGTMATMPAAAGDGTFGAACAGLPTDPADPGSLAAMGRQPVATAASGNPQLTTLVGAVQQAGLVDTLNSAEGVTVFAPVNDAFAKIPKADLDQVLANQDMLKKVLTYHVVAGKIAPGQLAGVHKTLEGQDLTVSGSGSDFKVNGTSSIVCGNIPTRNATVYLVDGVLMPS